MVKGVDTGKSQRFSILKSSAEHKLLQQLQLHGWKTVADEEFRAGEYLVITAERGGHSHSIGLMYTSATDNKYYKILASQVEHIFINSPLYKLESFAHGINIPISHIDDFQNLLFKWNELSGDGKFAPTAEVEAHFKQDQLVENLNLISDNPIEVIWIHIRQLQSVTLAKKLIMDRARQEKYKLTDEEINSKAEGIAFALRNASDYFQAGKAHNLSQRIVNVYYGALALASAEILASSNGSNTLSEIEKFTKQGHGLYTLDNSTDSIEHLIVGIISSGFFSAWLKSMNLSLDGIPARKPRAYTELSAIPVSSWLTLEQLFASIPELSNLFNKIFDIAPRYVTLAYDQNANFSFCRNRSKKIYALFIDKSTRLKKEDIAKFSGPISDISSISEYPGNNFRAAVDHTGKKTWWEALNIHTSSFSEPSLILPIFGVVSEYRMICVVLLYTLSIIVRYRPSVWRRVQEGDLDYISILIEEFLNIMERVLPQQFLEQVLGKRVFVRLPGSFS